MSNKWSRGTPYVVFRGFPVDKSLLVLSYQQRHIRVWIMVFDFVLSVFSNRSHICGSRCSALTQPSAEKSDGQSHRLCLGPLEAVENTGRTWRSTTTRLKMPFAGQPSEKRTGLFFGSAEAGLTSADRQLISRRSSTPCPR